jgi:cytoskeletal protein RodZ
MPETRLERALFVLGLAAIAVLGVLIAHYWHNTSTAAPLRSATAADALPTTDAAPTTRRREAPARPPKPATTAPTETIATTSASTAAATTTEATTAATTSTHRRPSSC